jgi:S1-C subfamily serine protease
VFVSPKKGSLGSGFFVGGDGLIVTNRHVIDGFGTVGIWLRDGRRGKADVVTVAPDTDLALLRTSLKPPAVLRLSRGGDARIGREVMAIGAPEGLSWSVSKGIVSSLRDTSVIRLVQTDAAINHGNSGGPLIDIATRRVIGVNTIVVRKDIAEGLNFAISSQDVLFRFGSYLTGAAVAN